MKMKSWMMMAQCYIQRSDKLFGGCLLILEDKGHGIEALSIGASIDQLVALKNFNSRQVTLHEYILHSVNIIIRTYTHYACIHSGHSYYYYSFQPLLLLLFIPATVIIIIHSGHYYYYFYQHHHKLHLDSYIYCSKKSHTIV